MEIHIRASLTNRKSRWWTVADGTVEAANRSRQISLTQLQVDIYAALIALIRRTIEHEGYGRTINLSGVILSEANLEDAKFCQTTMPDGTVNNRNYPPEPETPQLA